MRLGLTVASGTIIIGQSFTSNSKDADGNAHSANSSNGWWEYSEWLSFLFKKYDDIKEVVVQNTYWNRFRLTMMDPLIMKTWFPMMNCNV